MFIIVKWKCFEAKLGFPEYCHNMTFSLLLTIKVASAFLKIVVLLVIFMIYASNITAYCCIRRYYQFYLFLLYSYCTYIHWNNMLQSRKFLTTITLGTYNCGNYICWTFYHSVYRDMAFTLTQESCTHLCIVPFVWLMFRRTETYLQDRNARNL